ncbi:hypothetical protein BN1058_01833 [Paraliobacillus sp. PM-2]|uniref:hypothetical protein n=1 Tax=Paraliobacillus sp. PM-2 TaxID=1462524 RepID=UPI00061C9A00|nr:hypothetical protein [Paraliobacillus sp. PM-2]CQR47510.1 hypothetical protein BN1058_01833 [Paraliobacillus sp. PM-2]
MSEIKCLVCSGSYFRKGYYDLDLKLDIYSSAHNNVDVHNRSFNADINVDIDVDVRTDVYHDDIVLNGDLDLKLYSEDKRNNYPNYAEVYKYVCDNCGYIMSFIKEKQVESKKEEKERKQKERSYDWSDFGK